MKLLTPKLRQTSADDRHLSGTKKVWDCGCHRHLEAGSDEALVAKVIYHLAVQHPEAHATLEQADELVGTEAYDEPSWGGLPHLLEGDVIVLSEEALIGMGVSESLPRTDLRDKEVT
jgi:hypothetical protein